MHDIVEREKLIKYIEALEGVNQQLLTALKQCLILLAEVKASSPDKQGWQKILGDFENIIRCAEKVDQEKTVH